MRTWSVLASAVVCLVLACPAADTGGPGEGESPAGEGEGEGEGDVALILCDYDAATIDTCGFEEPASCPPSPPEIRMSCPSERLGCAYCRSVDAITPTEAVVCDLSIWIPAEEGCVE
jgi:hypothetical protein